MEEHPPTRQWKWFRAGILLMVLSIPAIIGFGAVRSVRAKAAGSQALSNARAAGFVLGDFEADYGSYPDASTMDAVQANASVPWNLKADTSNDLFRQVIAAGIVTNEEIWFTPTAGTHRPDNVIQPVEKALAAGECGFSYILGFHGHPTTGRPVLAAPLIPGTPTFDRKPFGGYAVVWRSGAREGTLLPIDASGRAMDHGKDLFDPSQPYWKGAPPDVKWADLPGPPITRASGWLIRVVPSALTIAVAILIVFIVRGRKRLMKKPEPPVVKER